MNEDNENEAGGPGGGPPDPPEPPHATRSPHGVEDFALQMPEDLDIRRCYRHPDRETGVSCSNCGRPICHECMTPAPVGFRCPECMAEQRGGLRVLPGGRSTSTRPQVITRQQTRARWQSGGLLGVQGNQVTRVLVALNVIMFIAEIAYGTAGGFASIKTQSAVDLGGLVPFYVALKHQYWRLFTAMFLHADLLHIALNMWALYLAGSYLESLAGRTKYLLIYFISGFAGNVMAYLFGPTNEVMLGASTAIFGVFGALFIYSLHNRNTVAGMALRSIGFVIAINLVFTFLNPSISWQGHIGGLLGGVAVMEAMVFAGRKDLRDRLGLAGGAAVVIIVAILVVAVIWRSATFPLF